jgi:hypothetical protein
MAVCRGQQINPPRDPLTLYKPLPEERFRQRLFLLIGISVQLAKASFDESSGGEKSA